LGRPTDAAVRDSRCTLRADRGIVRGCLPTKKLPSATVWWNSLRKAATRVKVRHILTQPSDVLFPSAEMKRAEFNPARRYAGSARWCYSLLLLRLPPEEALLLSPPEDLLPLVLEPIDDDDPVLLAPELPEEPDTEP
jgi:hypothetical protein